MSAGQSLKRVFQLGVGGGGRGSAVGGGGGGEGGMDPGTSVCNRMATSLSG